MLRGRLAGTIVTLFCVLAACEDNASNGSTPSTNGGSATDAGADVVEDVRRDVDRLPPQPRPDAAPPEEVALGKCVLTIDGERFEQNPAPGEQGAPRAESSNTALGTSLVIHCGAIAGSDVHITRFVARPVNGTGLHVAGENNFACNATYSKNGNDLTAPKDRCGSLYVTALSDTEVAGGFEFTVSDGTTTVKAAFRVAITPQ
jgi:hypothetical protein